MWSKILTIVNTLLILSLVGLGFFVYEQNRVTLTRLETEHLDVRGQIEGIQEQMTKLAENPLFELGLNPLDTLKLDESGLVGFVQVSGYLTENTEEAAYRVLALKNPTDESLLEYVDAQIANNPEAVYDKDEEFVYIPFTCDESSVADLAEMTAENLGDIRLFFGGETDLETCPAEVSNWQVL